MAKALDNLARDLFWTLNRYGVRVVHRHTMKFDDRKRCAPFPPQPYVIVANHGNFADPWMLGWYNKRGLSIMMNDDGFREGGMTSAYLKHIGAFPKRKGAHDYRAMKTTLQELRNGRSVLIFPEGQTTWDGETQPIHAGVEKIVKRAKCGLVTVRIRGNFLTKPWWAETPRLGMTRMKFNSYFPEQIAEMSDSQLLDTMKTDIYQNDVKDPDNLAYPITGKDLALGLERFLWICPHCRSEDRLATTGDDLTCRECDTTWRMDAHCRFEPAPQPNGTLLADLKDLADWHRTEVRKRIQAWDRKSLLTSSDSVVRQRLGEHGRFENVSTGNLRLVDDAVRYESQDGNSLTAPLSEIRDYVIQKKDVFEFAFDGQYHRFVFDHHSPMKWVFYLRYLNGYEECEKTGILS